MRRQVQVQALVVAAFLAGCGGAQRSADSEALERIISAKPGDVASHRALARRSERPGLALRELLWLLRHDELLASDGLRLGELLRQRGRLRLALADPGSLADFERARDAGIEIGDETYSESLALCAAAALRHSSHFHGARANECLQRLPPESVYRRHEALASLGLNELVVIWNWLERAGAKRKALEVAQAYVDRGGRELSLLERWRLLHRWWHGRSRPLLPTDAASLLPTEATALSLLSASHERDRAQHTVQSLAGQWGRDSWRSALGKIASEYRQEPELADRRARNFAHESVYEIPRVAILSELFFRLGDTGRALAWAEQLARRAPQLPACLEAAGLANAWAGNVPRADIFFTRAAAASGDGGAVWARAQASYTLAGQPLAAVAAGRKALQLTSRGWDMIILLRVARAQVALGRASQAQTTMAALWSHFPASEAAQARTAVAAFESQARLQTESPSLLGELRESFGFVRPDDDRQMTTAR